ncbi:MAG: hypothetical protein AAFU78_04920 [Cyanobacteria bacterium J06633_2]
MNTSAMNASSNSTEGSASIVHVPHPHVRRDPQSQRSLPKSRTSAKSRLRQRGVSKTVDARGATTVDIGDEMVERFRGYYQRFVGYPTTDFQLPANTSVRYSLLQHTGTRVWDAPVFKASIAGFGGVLTTLSVGFLLSDGAPDFVTSDALNYSLPDDSATLLDFDAGVDRVDPIALDTSHQTLSDRPETISNPEFSSVPEAPIELDVEPLDENFDVPELSGISLGTFTERRFDVQLQTETPVSPDAADAAAVTPQPTNVVEPESIEIATEFARRPVVLDAQPINSPPLVEPLPVAGENVDATADVADADADQQLSTEAVTNISEKFAATLTDKSAEAESVDSIAPHSTTVDPIAPSESSSTHSASPDAISVAPVESELIAPMMFPASVDRIDVDAESESPVPTDAESAVSDAEVQQLT